MQQTRLVRLASPLRQRQRTVDALGPPRLARWPSRPAHGRKQDRFRAFASALVGRPAHSGSASRSRTWRRRLLEGRLSGPLGILHRPIAPAPARFRPSPRTSLLVRRTSRRRRAIARLGPTKTHAARQAAGVRVPLLGLAAWSRLSRVRPCRYHIGAGWPAQASGAALGPCLIGAPPGRVLAGCCGRSILLRRARARLINAREIDKPGMRPHLQARLDTAALAACLSASTARPFARRGWP